MEQSGACSWNPIALAWPQDNTFPSSELYGSTVMGWVIIAFIISQGASKDYISSLKNIYGLDVSRFINICLKTPLKFETCTIFHSFGGDFQIIFGTWILFHFGSLVPFEWKEVTWGQIKDGLSQERKTNVKRLSSSPANRTLANCVQNKFKPPYPDGGPPWWGFEFNLFTTWRRNGYEALKLVWVRLMQNCDSKIGLEFVGYLYLSLYIYIYMCVCVCCYYSLRK